MNNIEQISKEDVLHNLKQTGLVLEQGRVGGDERIRTFVTSKRDSLEREPSGVLSGRSDWVGGCLDAHIR